MCCRRGMRWTLSAACAVASFVTGSSFYAQEAATQAQSPSSLDASLGEELTRGPLHEAFAVPIDYNPAPSIVVTQTPPDDIEEVPPDIRPDDPNVIWLAGYWQWDDERGQYLWISGLWRVPPPGRRWVPGYWTHVEGGFQRVPGFWAPVEAAEVVYYQAPPPSLETGPNAPPPSPEYFWVPGQWLWQDGRYVWQPGYWARPEPQWCWVPPSYCWTPGGYIYQTGYWDYPPVNRGMVFAPVYFQPVVYRRPAFVYAPRIVLRVEILLAHLFARPSCRSYYFGDYYGPSYANRGYYPWFASGRSNGWYDPIYAFHQGQFGGRDPNWSNRYREQYDRYRNDSDSRPRHTFAEQQDWVARRPEFAKRSDFMLASTLGDSLRDKTFQDRVTRVSQTEIQDMQRRARDFEQFAELRREREQHGKLDLTAGNANSRGPLKLPTWNDGKRTNSVVRVEPRDDSRPGPGPGRGFIPTDDLRIVPDGDRPKIGLPGKVPTDDLRIVPDKDRPREFPQFRPPQFGRPDNTPTDDLRMVPDGDRPKVTPPNNRPTDDLRIVPFGDRPRVVSPPSGNSSSTNRPIFQFPQRSTNENSRQPKTESPKTPPPQQFNFGRPSTSREEPRMNFGGGNRSPSFEAPNFRVDRAPRGNDAPKIQMPKNDPPRIERPNFQPPQSNRSSREPSGNDRSNGNGIRGKKDKD